DGARLRREHVRRDHRVLRVRTGREAIDAIACLDVLDILAECEDLATEILTEREWQRAPRRARHVALTDLPIHRVYPGVANSNEDLVRSWRGIRDVLDDDLIRMSIGVDPRGLHARERCKPLTSPSRGASGDAARGATDDAR